MLYQKSKLIHWEIIPKLFEHLFKMALENMVPVGLNEDTLVSLGNYSF